MNKDSSLKTNEQKMVLLMLGNVDTGKKSITRLWGHKFAYESEENRTFYKIFNLLFEDTIDDCKVSLPVEIRVMNGDEIETDMKVNSSFFKGALGAFVVVSIEDFMSFQDGTKWKEKADMMCCLPNKFPLPVHLLINKCDKIDRVKRSPWLKQIQLDNYVRENQFFNHFFISAESSREMNRDSCMSNQSVDVESPLKDMIRTILQFKDLKEKLLNGKSQGKGSAVGLGVKQSLTKDLKESQNYSTSSNRSDVSVKKQKQGDRGGSCSIL